MSRHLFRQTLPNDLGQGLLIDEGRLVLLPVVVVVAVFDGSFSEKRARKDMIMSHTYSS